MCVNKVDVRRISELTADQQVRDLGDFRVTLTPRLVSHCMSETHIQSLVPWYINTSELADRLVSSSTGALCDCSLQNSADLHSVVLALIFFLLFTCIV
jgi:hypothetical protein